MKTLVVKENRRFLLFRGLSCKSGVCCGQKLLLCFGVRVNRKHSAVRGVALLGPNASHRFVRAPRVECGAHGYDRGCTVFRLKCFLNDWAP